MAVDYYMVLVGQDGKLFPSPDPVVVDFPDPFPSRPVIVNAPHSVFEITGFSFQVDQSLTIAPQSTSGRATFSQMRVVRNCDELSPKLFRLCTEGANLKNLDILVHKVAGATVSTAAPSNSVYFGWGLKDVIIKSVAYAHGQEAPTETLSLEYRVLAVGSAGQSPDGSPGTFTYLAWDQVANAATS
jgi:type VI protein secretion system component Hcp